MVLDEIEAAVAVYLFGTNKCDKKHGKETLITTTFCNGDRATLKTLMPKEFLDQDVLNLVAFMLTKNERMTCKFGTSWFLPTTFSQYALGWCTHPTTVRGYYQEDFMGKLDYVSKIFVPINDENMHWFLLVVDLQKQELILLDSLPCATRKDNRRRYVKQLGLYLEHIFCDDSFYEFHTTKRPIISDFKLVEPDNMGEQLHGS